MEADRFLRIIESMGATFFAGVPDSLLSPLTDAVIRKYGIGDKHIVAANEGAAVGLAAGHFLATGKPAVIYMQNSGIGNAANPICSLLHEKVYAIPVIFIIGWRGEPGVGDEPQHVFQGEITIEMLKLLGIPYAIVSQDVAGQSEAVFSSMKSSTITLTEAVSELEQHIKNGQSVAFVIRKGALRSGDKTKQEASMKPESETGVALTREEALGTIMGMFGEFILVCSTGKLSREVFEIRERQGAGHSRDFLTVGSMGHSISIAQGIAREKSKIRIICLDGDGAALMHMGSLAVAGTLGTENLVHIVINNGAHESVGGMPTVCAKLNLSDIAKNMGYKESLRVKSIEQLEAASETIKNTKGPIFIETICNTKSRKNLGRPTTTPIENKTKFMKELGVDSRCL